MTPSQIPSFTTLEAVLVTPYEVTSTPKTIDPYAVDIAVQCPSGTVATVQTASGVTFDTAGVSLNSNGRPLANTFIVSRASGSGTILVLVSRVSGRAIDNA